MTRLIYSMNVSLDGYAATDDGGLDWADVDEEVHAWFNDEARNTAAVLYGRRMYELMAGYWPTAEDDPQAPPVIVDFAQTWKRTPKVVFSRTLDEVAHESRLVRGDPAGTLAALRQEFDGDLAVGGPTLAAEFIALGLVDEYRVLVHPVILGGGLPFWPRLERPVGLRLLETRSFGNGVVLLAYAAR